MSTSHHPQNLNNKFKLGIILNTIFTIFEFIVGFASGSLALISDAGHNLTDSLSLLIAYLGNKVSKREANEDHTFGYSRATVLTALLNAIILLSLSLFIFYEAYIRIFNPEPVQGGLVAVVALVGIFINGSIALLFRSEQSDLNARSAYINMLFDALASVGALVAGLLILFTGITVFEPIASIIIGLFVLRVGWAVVRDALHILLEGVPSGIKTELVRASILEASPDIKNVDDLHIWALSSHLAALSCHIVIEDCDIAKSMKIIKQIKEDLKHKYKIEHATIETELVECPPGV